MPLVRISLSKGATQGTGFQEAQIGDAQIGDVAALCYSPATSSVPED